MSEERESTPSLVGSSIRSVDNNHDRPASTRSTSRSTSRSKVKKSNTHHYTTVNDLVHEGALVNEEQEYDALLDEAGNVKKDVSRDNVIISANEEENKPEAEAATAITTKGENKEDDAEDAGDASSTKAINDDGVEDYNGIVDAQALEREVKIDDSSLKGFVVVDIPKEEPESNPTIYELKNDAAGTDISLENLIDSQIASISDFSADLKKKVGKKKSTAKKQRKRSNSGVLPDQVIENDAVQQVPAGAPEGVYSPLVQSREQSKIRDSSRSSAAPEKPNLARGDSYTGKTANELRTGRRSTRDDPLRLLNQSSKDYLRSVSRSRSRISQKVPHTPTPEELEAEGALCNDPEHDAELDQAQNDVIEHVDLQNEVLHEEDEEDVPSGTEVSQLLREAKEAPLKPIKSPEQKLDEPESEVIDVQAETASAKEVAASEAGIETETKEEEARDVEPITKAPESTGATEVAESVEETNVEEVEGTGPDVAEEKVTEEAEKVRDEPESPDITEENNSDPVLEITESLKATTVAEDAQEVEEATKEERNAEKTKEASKSIVVESEGTTEAEDNVEVKVYGEDKEAAEETAEVSKELKDDKDEKTGPVKPEIKDEPEAEPKVKESQPDAEEDDSKEAETSFKVKVSQLKEAEAEQDENSITEENENLEDNKDDSDIKELSQNSSSLKIDSTADVAERLVQESEAEIYGDEREEKEAESDSKDIEVDEGSPEAEKVPVKVETIGKQAKDFEEETKGAAIGLSGEKQLATNEPREETEALEPEPKPEAAAEEEEEEFYGPTKEEIIEMLKDEPVYIYTSLAGGGFHMPTRTNKLVTILTANRIPFTYRDLGTDEEARNVWRRYGKGRMLPGVVRGKDDIIGNWEEIEEANEDYRVRELVYETL